MRATSINLAIAFDVDLENSTGIASLAPRAYEWVQDAHDTLMRDLITAYGAYEINTEGDAFHVAFQDAATAVQFCMEMQYEMMEIEWPKEVLKLPGCEAVYSKSGQHWVYRGPRIRMGIHWADEHSVTQHLHSLTKHRFFSGAAFQITRDLCEAAKGGQVLLTHDVWMKLCLDMPSASFPIVEQLGSYIFDSSTRPIWVYQVRGLIGRPLKRPTMPSAGALKNAKLSNPGSGLSVVPVPVPQNTRGDLSFLAIRIDKSSISVAEKDTCLPKLLQNLLFEVISVCAMQYAGYAYRNSAEGYYMLVFESALNALKMSHTLQMLAMTVDWPSELHEWCCNEEHSAEGKLLFKGPKMAVGIHLSSDYSIRPVPLTKPNPIHEASLTDYLGPGEEITKVLSDVAHGGQVILSENAWAAVQDQLPGGPHVISLGTHIIKESCFSGPMMLMEVMPKQLNKRSFGKPNNTTIIDPGYREAPSAKSAVSIAHLRVVKPSIVVEAEKSRGRGGTALSQSVISSYRNAMSIASAVVRDTLRYYEGYECKEPQPGRFTLAFEDLQSCIRWAATVQAELISSDWPEEILGWPECAEIYDIEKSPDSDAGSHIEMDMVDETSQSVWSGSANPVDLKLDYSGPQILWKGLTVRIGIASGLPQSKAPLNTGRADYFGTIPNLAARLVTLCQPGQILFDASRLDSMYDLQWNGESAYLPGLSDYRGKSPGGENVEITPVGQLKIKGLDELRSVFQAVPISLQRREFAENKAVVRSMVASNIARRLASLRRSSEASSGTHPVLSDRLHRKSTGGIFSSISRQRENSLSLKRINLSFVGRGASGDSNSDFMVPIVPVSTNADTSNTMPISCSESSSVITNIAKLNLDTHHTRKNSESSLATTPKSFMSHEKVTFQKSPERNRRHAGPSNELPVFPKKSTETLRRSDGGYDSLDDFASWEEHGQMAKTPTALTKVVDHWDASLAIEEALGSQHGKSDEDTVAPNISNSAASGDVNGSEDEHGNNSPANSTMTTDSMHIGASAYHHHRSRYYHAKKNSADDRYHNEKPVVASIDERPEEIDAERTAGFKLWKRPGASNEKDKDDTQYRLF